MKGGRMRDSPSPFGLELFAHAVEELAHEHLGDAAQHALADAGYRAADLAVGVDADGCVLPIRPEADARLAADEAGPSAALDVQGVAVRLVLVRDAHLAVVGAADGGDPDLHRRGGAGVPG